ncbi:MAG: hypothetical protein HN348_27625 [Proteobacteria bacterium]|nr:hypothetical protein [Pseudomonadota bacterium]
MGPHHLLVTALAVLAGATLSNTTRIVALFLGPTEAWLQEPAHSAIGLVALCLGALLPLGFVASLAQRPPVKVDNRPSPPLPFAAVLAFAALALAVSLAPHHPVDVSAPIKDQVLPANLGHTPGSTIVLTTEEEAYFNLYGGSVEKRSYGAHSAMLIRTTQPVRHLHSPANCLRGSGHEVTRLGIRPDELPTTVWRTIDPDGMAWRVETSLLSAHGRTAETVSEVVWHWMAEPETWMLLERISPWTTCEQNPSMCTDFDAALLAAIDFQRETS